jgi:hypothetical protein
MDDPFDGFDGQARILPKGLLLRFGEALTALLALPALYVVPSVETRFYHIGLAIVARHVWTP